MTHLRQVPKRPVKENLIQEQLYIEEHMHIIKVPQKNENKDEIERGVVVIDLF